MERERLTRLVQDAAAVDRSDLSELDALAERFPWFAGVQVLRSAGAQRAGDVMAEETLRDAAAHVPSRSVLFDISHQERTPRVTRLSEPQPEPAAPAPVGEGPAFAEPVLSHPGMAPTKLSESGPLVDSPSESASGNTVEGPVDGPALSPSSVRSDPTVEEQAVMEALDDLIDPPHPPEHAADADPLERQMLESALASAYDLTWVHGAPSAPQRPEARSTLEDPITFPPQGPLVPQAPLEHKPAITRHGKYSFMTWLEADQNTFVPEERPQVHDAPVPTAVTDWVRSAVDEEEPAEEVRPRQPSKPTMKPLPEDPTATSELIDAFIKQQVPVAPAKAEFFTPQQAAKRSLDDKAGLVTETLARVYAKQGNLPKAIEAYKRLALKYPEKSAYFAALQKELEAQLNK